MKKQCAIFMVSILASLNSIASPECLLYEPDFVVLTGKVIEKTFYGPPNYGESPKTDRKEKQLILELGENICIAAAPSDNINIAESNVNEVTLVFLNTIPNIKNKHVEVSGSIFHAHTGHHRTPLLITVSSVNVVSK
jgi:hypothetical protein